MNPMWRLDIESGKRRGSIRFERSRQTCGIQLSLVSRRALWLRNRPAAFS